MEYRVLTLWQPWSSLLVHGVKKIETRPAPTSWTQEKGTYLIHAASKWSKEQAEICIREPFKSALEKLGCLHHYDNEETGYKGYSFSFPMGAIIGAVEVANCSPIALTKGGTPFLTDPLLYSGFILNPEWAFGDYREGRYGWECQNQRLLKTPIPYKGGHGYYQKYKGDESKLIFV